ncbi:MAG TPA: hypothetical protein VFV52_18185 [Bacilli bacterium]|nr:hypothetical protein [Bacilli bacterium]
MKNERIITHFQSYTTADSCVKDLTPYFAGKISVISTKRDLEAFQEGAGEADDAVRTLTELGGITLGTMATLLPGLGPVLTGGPVAGKAVGDTVGDYLNAMRHADGGENDPFVLQQGHGMQDTTPAEMVIVTVDVQSEQEAEQAMSIMKRYANGFHRTQGTTRSKHRPGTGVDPIDYGGSELGDNSDINESSYPLDAVAPPGDVQPDGYPQAVGQSGRRIPADDGYELDPLRPVSDSHWVDPNVGYGNLDIVDPALTYAPDLAQADEAERDDDV